MEEIIKMGILAYFVSYFTTLSGYKISKMLFHVSTPSKLKCLSNKKSAWIICVPLPLTITTLIFTYLISKCITTSPSNHYKHIMYIYISFLHEQIKGKSRDTNSMYPWLQGYNKYPTNINLDLNLQFMLIIQ